MNGEIAQKNRDNKKFIIILYKQSLIFDSKNDIISITLNQSHNCCLYFLKVRI